MVWQRSSMQRVLFHVQEAVLGNPCKHPYFFFYLWADCFSKLSSWHVQNNPLLCSNSSWLLWLLRDHSGSWQSWGVKEKLDLELRRLDIVILALLSCWRQFDVLWSITLNHMGFESPVCVLLCIFVSSQLFYGSLKRAWLDFLKAESMFLRQFYVV